MSSDSESEDEDVFDAGSTSRSVNNTEHSDPNSYSWLVLKLASLRIVQQRLNDFIAASFSSSLISVQMFIEANACRLLVWS